MSVLNVPVPEAMADEEIAIFAGSVERFLAEHAGPDQLEDWRSRGVVDRDLWRKAGRAGLLGLSAPAEYGGVGGDFRHEAVLIHAIAKRGLDAWGVPLHNAIVMPYVSAFGTEQQKSEWIPRLTNGDWVGAIAMTEPGAGSDLQGVRTTARRNGDDYIVNGSKIFITNGQTADFVIVVCRTAEGKASGAISLLAVEAQASPGFVRGRNLKKVGMEAADTSELFFNDMVVPARNLLGSAEGQGFYQLMGQLPQERLIIALQAMGMIEAALEVTLDYVKTRKAFGRPLLDNQTVQFNLAECKTEATVAKTFVESCLARHLAGELDGTTAAMAKYWVTDLQAKIVDRCLQLHGGYGYMDEYPIARMFKDARVSRIYGGTNEIMKMLVARSL